ncbi:hypothetical protein GUJ93_ZPchr0012g21423 [Zizania palustris]|uniref:Uncharacterized protein n=1 Tax=Zizania palustris TaxID=103762 RepID=A0A8J5WGU3_ZIZPA|nr:hypothetical protein GUJ93_ZPchr0012g21423 [Zizania palustris]
MDNPFVLGPKALLTKVIGYPSCDNTAPRLYSLATVSITNCLEKSGNARTGAVTRACFKARKADSSVRDHLKGTSFLSTLVSGLLMTPNP